jgi:peptidoglycan/LPS O-acetylase OafA/YrhL
MSLYERIILEFCIIVAGAALLWEFIRMWRERRRTRKELWRVLYEQRRRDGGA